MATQQVINIGTLPNDGEGDPLRVAFGKINNNFSNLFATFVNTSNTYSTGNTPGQVIFETPVSSFTNGVFTIRSNDPGTDDAQNITLSAQLNTAGNGVKFTGYATTFTGNAICNYDMDVFGSNVRVLVSPFTTASLFHFVSSQIMYVGNPIPGLELQLDGYPIGQVMSTENDYNITTED
jgi:hypothetical protein